MQGNTPTKINRKSFRSSLRTWNKQEQTQRRDAASEKSGGDYFPEKSFAGLDPVGPTKWIILVNNKTGEGMLPSPAPLSDEYRDHCVVIPDECHRMVIPDEFKFQ
ncbi:hypothetical protein CEXT_275901 [Caerostris extrusa]|uniref:Uncharacterized protein n=1 Tax=Caerostris extrusa TaxID=172846 RepID=A0AAV4U385_CAEEX|nr:hypothetical protein CEXT_275901 [Caerostris extrusa]